MTFEMGTFIGLACAIIGGAMGYGRLQRTVEAQEKGCIAENGKIWGKIHRIEEVAEAHNKDSEAVRRELDREMSRIREAAGAFGGKLDLILLTLAELKVQVKELQDQEKKNRA